MPITDQHPYQVGRYLHIDFNNNSTVARIHAIFSGFGSDEVIFTNSCTVLLECDAESCKTLTDISGVQIHDNLVVLKVFDATYSETLREQFYCPVIGESLKDDYDEGDSNSDTTDVQEATYISRFNSLLPQRLITGRQIQDLIYSDYIPSKPTYGDVVKAVLGFDNMQKTLVAQGVLEKTISHSDREQYLQKVAESMFEHEKVVFRAVERMKTAVLPKLLCPARVRASQQTISSHKRRRPDVPALFLEYLPGSSLRTWYAEALSNRAISSPHSAPDTLIEDVMEKQSSGVLRDLKDISSQLFLHLHALMYCGLAPVDVRIDNIHVHRSVSSGRLIVRLYDAGANTVVMSTHSCTVMCEKHCPNACVLTDMAQECKRQYFTKITENSALGLIEEMTADLVRRNKPSLDQKTACFEILDDPAHTVYWQILMLSFWYYDDVTEALEVLPQTIDILQKVRWILRTSRLTSVGDHTHREHWAFIALARLCHAYGKSDYLEAVGRMSASVFECLWAIEQDGTLCLHGYYADHPELPFQIFRTTDPIPQHRWRTGRHNDDFNLELATDFVPDLRRLVDVVQSQYARFPTKLLSNQFGMHP